VVAGFPKTASAYQRHNGNPPINSNITTAAPSIQFLSHHHGGNTLDYIYKKT
jgi:hypothetical protein